MTARTESDEKYVLGLVAEVLAEPDYRWQHRFPTLLGDPSRDGRQHPLPVDGYFPRHRLMVEYWERQHSEPVPIMDEGMTVSHVSRGHQRRLYDARREAWARANGLRFVILDHRGFVTDERGRLSRNPSRDRLLIARALAAAGVLAEPNREPIRVDEYVTEARRSCFICRLVSHDPSLAAHHVVWQDPTAIAFLDRFPAVFGHVLVAPSAHHEQVTGHATLHTYLALQRVLYAVAEAVRLTLNPERVYLLSLGSQKLNAHVHWHVVPCPPGLPLHQQQLALLDREAKGALSLSHEEGKALAHLLRDRLPPWMRERASP